MILGAQCTTLIVNARCVGVRHGCETVTPLSECDMCHSAEIRRGIVNATATWTGVTPHVGLRQDVRVSHCDMLL